MERRDDLLVCCVRLLKRGEAGRLMEGEDSQEQGEASVGDRICGCSRGRTYETAHTLL